MIAWYPGTTKGNASISYHIQYFILCMLPSVSMAIPCLIHPVSDSIDMISAKPN